MDHQPALAVLRRKEVERIVGLSRSELYRRVSAGTFPAPIALGVRSVGWLRHEVAAWLSDRVAASRETV
jgi:prophage regulatory protein